MEYHLDRKVILIGESEFKSLYKWSLCEVDSAGKKLGTDQVPWGWTLYFTTLDFELYDSFSIEQKPLANPNPVVAVESRSSIRAKIRPGHWNDLDSGERYSMFGTGRAIENFDLWIYPLDNESEQERCAMWGSLAYTAEIDFRDEEMSDTLSAYLHVKPSRFAHYAEILRSHQLSIATLRLGTVHGFYSEWSPSISTQQIKVLTNLEDHKLLLPEGTAIVPPSLGEVGKFELTFITKHECDKPTRPVELVEDALEEIAQSNSRTNANAYADQTSLLQHASLKLGMKTEQRLKHLLYASCVIALLLLALVLRR